jgi:hypothetical protein
MDPKMKGVDMLRLSMHTSNRRFCCDTRCLTVGWVVNVNATSCMLIIICGRMQNAELLTWRHRGGVIARAGPRVVVGGARVHTDVDSP